MRYVQSTTRFFSGRHDASVRHLVCTAMLAIGLGTFGADGIVHAEDDMMRTPGSGMAGKTSGANKDALANELRALRKQVTDLRSALERDKVAPKRTKPRRMAGAAGAMPGNSSAAMMGSAPAMAMDDDSNMSGSMPARGGRKTGASGGMDMDMDSGEMGAMGTNPSNAASKMGADGMSGANSMAPMAMDDDMDMMPAPDAGSSGGMAMDSSEMGGMSSGGGPMPGGQMAASGMKAMGCCMAGMNRMGGTAGTTRPMTSLPGFPGRSHLYHIGAEGFFLNHPQHIALGVDQQVRLNRIREQALLTNATYERQAAEAEQALFVLTGADLPDTVKIHEQLRVIADLRAEQRAAFIRAVGEAAEVLTDSQRDALLGRKPTS